MNHTARQCNPENTRQRLLAAAHREIYERGFQAASLERILADTGLSKGALYHHFDTKQALGIAVVEEVIAARVRREWIDPLMRAERPLEALAGLLEQKLLNAAPENVRLGCDLNNLIQEMSPCDEVFRNALHTVLQEWTDALTQTLRRARALGQIRPEVDCKQTALFIIASMEGCAGLSKNLQDIEAYRGCMRTLGDYLQQLGTHAAGQSA
ncbi:hypothetical protein BJI67_08865 [Acidihalobacter aeolianus]|uniref:HTH tetR-type domain-containing protein n=1 Tax=Acidihalobacter aeolianus TaxID=2792603 RepID=A0A1D8K861_9GAMM|nr:TetR/AcrR family transcriptional regulator [Acidihalobacter aeolianus]AOV17157.1 hypothetical protein BJI67_08865 [Acidihalobacter aeolianus]